MLVITLHHQKQILPSILVAYLIDLEYTSFFGLLLKSELLIYFGNISGSVFVSNQFVLDDGCQQTQHIHLSNLVETY